MPEGFFAASVLAQSKPPPSLVAKCGACGLYKTCKSPKMSPTGKGKRNILVVAEAPGAEEDDKGVQLIGQSGQKFRQMLKRYDVDLDRDCTKTNTLICFTGDTQVTSPSPISKLYRRVYSGSLVCIKTFAGRVFTGTPNHPILTSLGWVPLGLLEKGQDLLHYTPIQRTELRGSNVEDPPATFEELSKSLVQTWDVQRVVGSGMDFHGDGEEGNVDVVCPNSLLRDGGKSSSLQPTEELPLETGSEDTSLLGVPSSGESNPLHLLQRPLASTESVVGCLGVSGPTLGAESFHSQEHSFALSPKSDSKPFEDRLKSFVTNTEGAGQWLQSLPGTVTLDRIVEVERMLSDQSLDGLNASNGSCHVYNLETSSGYYMVDGIVVSNCRPPDNATPTDKQIGYCRPNLIKTINEVKPTTILLLGGPAVEAVVGWAWKESVGPIGRWVGWNIPHQRLNAWICPLYHPSYLLRENNEALDLIYHRHLKKALSHTDPPWPNGTPNYKEQVECIMSPTKAAKAIRGFIQRGRAAAFDYETNRLKPERKDSQIVCCSISDGKRTIAYPWHGEAIEATREFVRSPVPKIASNMKFEERWTRRILKTRVKNWRWCTMTGAHILDHRQAITGIKFQSLVQLGFESYDDHIGPYLQGKGGQGLNKILSEIDLQDLLLYCGEDSLVEYLVAKIQTPQIGWSLRP